MHKQQFTLTAEEVALKHEWETLVARYEAGDTTALPPEVQGVGTLRVMGRSGDEPVRFPRVQRSALATLDRVVQFGVELAQRTIGAHRAQGSGRMVFVTARHGQPLEAGELLDGDFDPEQDSDLMIVAPIAGGQ